MPKHIDFVGKRFGRLVVVETIKKDGRYWSKCLCDCGNTIIVRSYCLSNGNTISCGCYRKELTKKYKTKHGKTNTRLFRIWNHIKERCFRLTTKKYQLYGGRGITMCDEWHYDFQSFYDWAMANGYKEDLTIDRIDVNGNYEPSNCRWATQKQQQNNRNDNYKVEYNGETLTLAEIATKYNIKYKKLWARVRKLKWNINEAVNGKKEVYTLDEIKHQNKP